MLSKTSIAFLLASLVCLPALASAQAGTTWRGQDNEFGSVRTPYNADVNGERAVVEAKVVLRKMYEDKEATFYMFAWTVEGTPLDVTFDNLVRTDTGGEMPCFQREGNGNDKIKCFVDRKDMPPVGTEIVMRGTVGSSRVGNFQVGAIIVPFTYTWLRVPMNNGLDAELFGYTVTNVQSATSSGRNILGGGGNPIPGLGAIGLIAAVGAAASLVAFRRKTR